LKNDKRNAHGQQNPCEGYRVEIQMKQQKINIINNKICIFKINKDAQINNNINQNVQLLSFGSLFQVY
jgi:hypothetical protein